MRHGEDLVYRTFCSAASAPMLGSPVVAEMLMTLMLRVHVLPTEPGKPFHQRGGILRLPACQGVFVSFQTIINIAAAPALATYAVGISK